MGFMGWNLNIMGWNLNIMGWNLNIMGWNLNIMGWNLNILHLVGLFSPTKNFMANKRCQSSGQIITTSAEVTLNGGLPCPVGSSARCVPFGFVELIIVHVISFCYLVHHSHTRWDGAQWRVDGYTKAETWKMVV